MGKQEYVHEGRKRKKEENLYWSITTHVHRLDQMGLGVGGKGGEEKKRGGRGRRGHGSLRGAIGSIGNTQKLR